MPPADGGPEVDPEPRGGSQGLVEGRPLPGVRPRPSDAREAEVGNVFRLPCDQGLIDAGRGTAACGAGQARFILIATILGSSMAFIDGTVVNVALPILQR